MQIMEGSYEYYNTGTLVKSRETSFFNSFVLILTFIVIY